jgi:hypothetical protein
LNTFNFRTWAQARAAAYGTAISASAVNAMCGADELEALESTESSPNATRSAIHDDSDPENDSYHNSFVIWNH